MAKVMIVDDSTFQRSLLRGHIQTAGHDVVGEAGTGEEALEMYKVLRPDLVTLDIIMPGMDGIECLKRLKEHHPAARVIMISAVGVKQKIREAIQHGCIDYITKPYNDFCLKDIISRHAAKADEKRIRTVEE